MAASDTICAISTPLGAGGIGIVRLSGPDAAAIADDVVRCYDNMSLENGPSHTLRLGRARGPEDELLDEVLVTVMRAPRTYTREDVVEINCHGGVMPLTSVLESVLAAGARMAEPGEFTKRAFLNGRIDLTRAAAVSDIIAARTPESHRAAAARLSGRFHKEVESLRTVVLDAQASLDASMDFPEDDLPEDMDRRYVDATRHAVTEIESLLDSAERGRMLREGVTVAITGRPNVGKSSLFNALLRSARAIVTPVPGTTRDIIEETVNIGGIPTVLMDGAGLREGGDTPEQMGIDAARSAVHDAAAVVLVLDASEPATDEDRHIVDELDNACKTTIVAVNKMDLPRELADGYIRAVTERLESPEPAIEVSAKNHTNIEDIEDILSKIFLEEWAVQGSPSYVTRVHEKRGLEDARDAMCRAIEGAETGSPADQVSADLREAVDALGIIIGAVTTDDILDRVFSEFCIGK